MPDHLHAGARPHSAAPDVRAIESCMYTWIFDERGREFRRVPRGTSPFGPVPPGAWVTYHRLDLHWEAACFAVSLNPEGTRVLRSWLHAHPCPRCGTAPSQGTTMAELSVLVERWRAELRAVDATGCREGGSSSWGSARPRRPFRGRDGGGL